MSPGGFRLVCPVCRGALTHGADSLRCDGCARAYPVLLGIPDLRVLPDPYIAIDADRAKGLDLAERIRNLDFEASVDLYYRLTSVVTPAQAALFRRGLLAAEARAAAALAQWEEASGEPAGGGFLDLGCGTGPLLVAAAARYRPIGVDIAFRWLVIARKRLEQAGVDVPLVCACAEALPFEPATFDRVAGESVLENVHDQAAAAAECRRVLRPGGRLFLTTPNRFSLGPDPHAGLWAGGWLPEAAVAAWVRRSGGIPPRRRLLSGRALRRLLGSAGFGNISLELPDVPAGQRAHFRGPKRWLIHAYRAVRRVPVLRQSLLAIGPLLSAVAAPAATAAGRRAQNR